MSERDRRDPSRLAGEDLSEGPTPETRHPHGDLDDVEDTTQGPTPETRRAVRKSKDDPAASGEPGSDPRTRRERAGNQDRTDDVDVDRGSERSKTGDSITRSEEELAVGTRKQEAGRVRMRKTVETDRVSETVPVEHEEARITREPVAQDEAHGGEIGEQTLEVELEEEVPEVEKRAVPKERVRLDKDTETEERTVDADLRKERIEVEHDEGLEERR